MIEGGPSNLLINKKTAISIRAYEPSGREFESLRARHINQGVYRSHGLHFIPET